MMASGADQEEVYTLLLTNIQVDSMLEVSVQIVIQYQSHVWMVIARTLVHYLHI